MRPPPPDTDPELPDFVDDVEDGALWGQITETAIETWRPSAE
jgi:hypothetical protein